MLFEKFDRNISALRTVPREKLSLFQETEWYYLVLGELAAEQSWDATPTQPFDGAIRLDDRGSLSYPSEDT